MMTLDTSPAPAYAIYQSSDYRDGTSSYGMNSYSSGQERFRAVNRSDRASAAQLQPAILMRVVNSMDQVSLSADPAPVNAETDRADRQMPPSARVNRAPSSMASLTAWQWISELVAAGASLVTAYVMAKPGIGRNDN